MFKMQAIWKWEYWKLTKSWLIHPRWHIHQESYAFPNLLQYEIQINYDFLMLLIYIMLVKTLFSEVWFSILNGLHRWKHILIPSARGKLWTSIILTFLLKKNVIMSSWISIPIFARLFATAQGSMLGSEVHLTYHYIKTASRSKWVRASVWC